MGEDLATVRELKERVKQVFEGLGYDLTPRYPYVLIRVIPKQRDIAVRGTRKIIVAPDKQNKPNWEGQVLKVWKPWNESVRWICNGCGRLVMKTVEHISSLKPGDHIVFPHFVGIPVPELCYYYKFGEYQLIEEKGIPAVVEYASEPTEERLRSFLSKFITDRYQLEKATHMLMQNASVIFNEDARTMSGL